MDSPTEIGELSKEGEARIGSQVYGIEGARINLGWEKFFPAKPTFTSSDEAVVVLPGWGAKTNTKPVDVLGRAFADNSHMPTYAITAEAEPRVNDSLYKEAEAVLQFLQEKGIKKVTLAGHSQGGSRAINLVVLLQERQKVDPAVEVKGLILIDSVGLYEQDSSQMGRKFAVDSLIGTSLATVGNVLKYARRRIRQRQPVRKAFSQSWYANRVPQTLDVGWAALSGMLKDVGPMINSRSGYWQRVGPQVKEMVAKNPRISQIRVPVILIHGAGDSVIDRKQIVPPKVEGQGWQEREKFLKANLFTSSPIVKMAVVEKAGRHGLPLFRDVARSGLHLLERTRRQLDTSRLQNPVSK